MAATKFTFSSFAVRLVVALVLVFTTYNPSGYSWFHWFTEAENKIDPLIALAAIVLVIGWAIYLRATMRSLGVVGTSLATALFAAIIWVLIDYELLSLESTTVLEYIILVMFSAIMATGLSWSHIRRRMSGQLDVDDTDEE
jgi:uncharacterized membrane protein